jgi:PAS domain S-box-containing protein
MSEWRFLLAHDMSESFGDVRLEIVEFSQSDRLQRTGEALVRDDGYFRAVLNALPAPIYISDAAGLILYYNEAAAALWGHRPELGQAQWCGSWKLYWPDGRQLPHDQCAMAIALKENRPILGMEAVAERPDGKRVPFISYPTPLYDPFGALVGAVNMLVDITDRKRAEEHAQHLAAVVEFSDDAIVTKDLNGIITSWNKGAERLFGYPADEVIGKPIALLIPLDRQDEEPAILQRIRRGEPIDHYETVRQRKDGTLVEISLTTSPMKNADGRIFGASKIARDITERRRAEEQQRLALREMNHRIRNLFALASGVVALSVRSAKTVKDLAAIVRERLGALARAHALTLPRACEDTDRPTTLHALIRTILLPYDSRLDTQRARVVVSGPDIPIAGSCVTSLALLVHELATNAAKYGALSADEGCVHIECSEDRDRFLLTWAEHGGPPVVHRDNSEGFGSLLARTTIRGQFGGEISYDWQPKGLTIRLSMARDRLS